MTSGLCIIGASGFLGARTLQRARADGRTDVRALVHRRPVAGMRVGDVVQGDAADSACLERLFMPDSVVLNFAYAPGDAGEKIAQAICAACTARGVARLVHLSTSSVYGTAPGNVISEDSPRAPATAYEKGKEAIEETFRRGAAGRFDLVLLRPTAVFGPGGRNLASLALRTLRQAWPRRYLRACVMGRRRMHAVDVDCVAAATLFVAAAPLEAAVEAFIVSQDEEPANDYASIEAFFARRFAAAAYPFPPLALPPALFSVALRLAGRTVTDPERRYSGDKLARRGFRPPRSFGEALEAYAEWFLASHARS